MKIELNIEDYSAREVARALHSQLHSHLSKPASLDELLNERELQKEMIRKGIEFLLESTLLSFKERELRSKRLITFLSAAEEV